MLSIYDSMHFQALDVDNHMDYVLLILGTIDEKKRMSECIIPAYRQFRTWALEFDKASLEAKRMIISELFSRIEIGRGYKVHCELSVTYKQFCTVWATLDKKINAIA